jgi:hypothetical protein
MTQERSPFEEAIALAMIQAYRQILVGADLARVSKSNR